MFLQTSFAQVTITPWKMNKGGGIISFSLTSHGDPIAYSKMNIPSVSDANWTSAPVNGNGEINFSVTSILSSCLNQLDFTYFETFINIPANFNVSNLNVSFTAADDGARAYIFNSSHPNGAFIGEIRLGQTAITANYASLTVAGESNRLVIVQFDDCPSGNNLTGAKVNVNGQVVAINNGGCTESNFFWSNAPTISGKTASGTINGVAYTYTSSVNVRTTSDVFQHFRFPSSFQVPNNNPTIQNIEPSTNTLTFASPMTNPVLVFSSIGGGQISVPINFSAPVEVLWSTHVGTGSSFVQNSPTKITGREAFAIVRMNGTFSSISFDYLVFENYVNFVFGADFSTTTPDTIAPTVTLNGSANPSINAGSPYTDPGATVTDNCDTSPTLMVSGSVNVNVPGIYTLTYNGVDASGNVSTEVTRTVTVIDPAPVVVTQNIVVDLDENGNVTITPDQIDNGSSSVVGLSGLALDISSFNCDNIGINTVILTATSTLGSTATGTATVTVQDVIAPGGDGSSAPAGLGAVPQLALDNVPEAAGFGLLYQLNIPNSAAWTSGIPYTVDNSALTGLNFSRVAYLLELDNEWVWVSMDAFTTNLVQLGLPQQNQAGHSFVQQRIVNNMTVVASNNSGLASRQNVATGNIEIWNYNYTPDNIAGVPNANGNIYDWGDRHVGSAAYSSFQIHDHGAQQVLLAYNRWGAGSNSDIGINNNTGNQHKDYTFMSNAGNYNVKRLYVFVGNSNAGSGVLTQDITVNLDANGNATITPQMIDNGTTDNCDIASYALDITTFDCTNLGANTVTLTVTDPSGNSATGTAVVTVVDNIAPTVITQDVTVNLDASGTALITIAQIDNASYDNCGIASITLDKTTFDCESVGDNTVTLTVTDVNGNVSTGTAVVTVVDNIVPTVITQDISATITNGSVTVTAAQIDNGSYDNCGIANMTVSPNTFVCGEQGDHIVTLTVTDNNGNVSTETATVTVIGDVPTISISDFEAVNGQKGNTIFLGYGPQSINLTTDVTGGSGFTYSWTSSTGEIIDNVAHPEISPEISTTYTVTVTNSNGCTATTSIYICVIDVRSFDKKGRYKGKILVCHHTGNGKHHLISISKNAVSKHLLNHGDTLGSCDAICITSSDVASSYNDDARDLSFDNGDSDSTEIMLIIYPNPVKNKVTISLNSSGDISGVVQVFDFTGRVIFYKSTVNLNKGVVFDMRRFNSGTYYVKVMYNGKTLTAIIFKE